MEIVKLVRQDIRIRTKIKLLPAKLVLHFNKVVAKTVLTSDFVAHGEVVNALEFVKAFVEETFAGTARPEDVPFM
jgi:hypothetical protein